MLRNFVELSSDQLELISNLKELNRKRDEIEMQQRIIKEYIYNNFDKGTILLSSERKEVAKIVGRIVIDGMGEERLIKSLILI